MIIIIINLLSFLVKILINTLSYVVQIRIILNSFDNGDDDDDSKLLDAMYRMSVSNNQSLTKLTSCFEIIFPVNGKS